MPIILLLLGLATGGGAAFGVGMIMGPKAAAGTAAEAPAKPSVEPPSFVASTDMIAPLVFADGRLAGYVKFDIQLEVKSEDTGMVASKLPLMLHAVNMRTWRVPLATGPDGLLADIEGIRKVVAEASTEAFGKHVVKRVAVTRAEPA